MCSHPLAISFFHFPNFMLETRIFDWTRDAWHMNYFARFNIHTTRLEILQFIEHNQKTQKSNCRRISHFIGFYNKAYEGFSRLAYIRDLHFVGKQCIRYGTDIIEHRQARSEEVDNMKHQASSQFSEMHFTGFVCTSQSEIPDAHTGIV